MITYYKITGPEIKVSKTDKEVPIRENYEHKDRDKTVSFNIAMIDWHDSFVPDEVKLQQDSEDSLKKILKENFMNTEPIRSRQMSWTEVDQEFNEAFSQGIIIDAKIYLAWYDKWFKDQNVPKINMDFNVVERSIRDHCHIEFDKQGEECVFSSLNAVCIAFEDAYNKIRVDVENNEKEKWIGIIRKMLDDEGIKYHYVREWLEENGY